MLDDYLHCFAEVLTGLDLFRCLADNISEMHIYFLDIQA